MIQMVPAKRTLIFVSVAGGLLVVFNATDACRCQFQCTTMGFIGGVLCLCGQLYEQRKQTTSP